MSTAAISSSVGRQLWTLKHVIAGLWLPPLLVLGFVLFARLYWQIPVLDLTGDPVMLTDSPPYLGAVSFLGVLVWCATAVVCLFAAQLLDRKPSAEWRGYLRFAGGLSLVLCLDDLYLLHEELFPKYLGVPQTLVLAAYAAAALRMVWRYRRMILASESVLLGLAFTMFAVSLAVDLLASGERQFYLAEDGAKLLGVVMWFGFHVRLALQGVRRQRAVAAPERRTRAAPLKPGGAEEIPLRRRGDHGSS
jgi:hypothetical protein